MARTPEESTNISPKCQKRMLELIEEYDCTIQSFAKLVGVSKEVIFRATKYAIIPSVKSLVTICNNLNCSIAYLLGETDDRNFIMSSSPSSFHERLTELAEENGVTFTQISKKMPFAPNSIFEWFRKKCLPSLEYLQALCVYFKVSADYMLGRTDYKD